MQRTGEFLITLTFSSRCSVSLIYKASYGELHTPYKTEIHSLHMNDKGQRKTVIQLIQTLHLPANFCFAPVLYFFRLHSRLKCKPFWFLVSVVSFVISIFSFPETKTSHIEYLCNILLSAVLKCYRKVFAQLVRPRSRAKQEGLYLITNMP